jgi:hypothetical protein
MIFCLFVFSTILKQLDRKFVAIFCEHGIRKFRYVSEIDSNLCKITWLSFCILCFTFFEWLAVQIWIIRRNSIKWTKSNTYSKHFDNYAKIEHVSLHIVGTYHKKFSEKNILCRVLRKTLDKTLLCRVSTRRCSAKSIVCWVSMPFAESWTLDKGSFAGASVYAKCLALDKVCIC